MKELPIVPGRDPARIESTSTTPDRLRTNATPPIEFQALLERLRDQARTLERTAEEPLNARDLPGAVHAAENSLRDALSIADGLVESVRSSMIRANPAPPAEAQ